MKASKGFTLIELLIYVALTALVVSLFATILIVITRIQTKQTTGREVVTQSSFVVSTIKRLVHDSTYVNVTTSTLTIGTNSSSTDPTIITIEGGAVTMKEAGNASSTLTSDKVTADTLAFTNFSNGSSQVIKIVLTLSYNTTNPQQASSQTIETSAAALRKNN